MSEVLNHIKAEEHVGLVYSVAKKFTGITIMEEEEIIAWGMVGLTKAIKKYDEKLGYAFSTYAVRAIRGEILRAFRDDKSRLGNRAMRINGEAKAPLPMSCFVVENEEGKETEAQLFVEGDFTEDIDLKIMVCDAVENLTDKERKLIKMYYFQEISQVELAKIYGVTQVQISRRLKKAITHLKEFMEAKEYVS